MRIFNISKITLAMVILLLAVILALGIGTVKVPFYDIVVILYSKLLNLQIPESIKSTDVVIIWTLRMPRVLLAMLVGASLGVSGAVIQSILKNPLASPYTLGISSGASLLVGLFIVFEVSFSFYFFSSLTFAGFFGGLITIFVIMFFSKKIDPKMSNFTIILVGMIFSLFLSSMTTLSASLVGDRKYREIMEWSVGSLANTRMKDVYAILPFFIVGLLGLMLMRRELDVISFGEEEALNIGVDVKKTKIKAIVFSMLLAGGAISVSGVIGFVGLVAPHIVRRVYGSKHGVVLPMSALYGAIFLVIADLVARVMLPPLELPVGAVTAFIGAPFFLFIFMSRRKKNA